MKRDFPAIWAESPATLRREPTNGEMANGFPCGPADLLLFNELIFRLAQVYSEVSYCITQSDQAPNQNTLTQLWAAIEKAAHDAAAEAIGNQPIATGSIIYRGTNQGSVNAILAVMDPVLTAYQVGGVYMVRLNGANTGAATANLGPGSKPVLRSNGTALRPGDMSRIAVLTYDGENLILANLAQEIAPPGSGFAGKQQRLGYLPVTGQNSNLTASFTVSFSGVVQVFSTLNTSPQNGNISNTASVSVNGVGSAGASDTIAGASTSIVIANVRAGDVVKIASDCTPSNDILFNASQYLIYSFIPG